MDSSDAVFAGGAEFDQSGEAVALSADGTVALVGATGFDYYPAQRRQLVIRQTGTARAYKWNAVTGVWGLMGFWADMAGSTQSEYSGSSVALSADGTVALVGAWQYMNYRGIARAFKWDPTFYYHHSVPPGRWARMGTNDADMMGAGSDHSAGRSVALSADGTVALVGNPGSQSWVPSRARAYKWRGSSWVEMGPGTLPEIAMSVLR